MESILSAVTDTEKYEPLAGINGTDAPTVFRPQ